MRQLPQLFPYRFMQVLVRNLPCEMVREVSYMLDVVVILSFAKFPVKIPCIHARQLFSFMHGRNNIFCDLHFTSLDYL